MGIPKQPRMLPRLGCSPQTDRKTPLLKMLLTQIVEHNEVELLTTQSLHTCVLVTLVQESTLPATKE